MSSLFSRKSKVKPKDSEKSPDSKGKLTQNATRNDASAGGLATKVAEIGNMGRTHFEGMMTPTYHKNMAHLNTVVSFMKAPASEAPSFTNAGADMATRVSAEKKASTSVKAPSDMLPAFAISQYANDSATESASAKYRPLASQHPSLASLYKPTLPMVPESSPRSRPSGTTTKTEFYYPTVKATSASRRPSISPSDSSTLKPRNYAQPSLVTQIYNPPTKTSQNHPPSLPHINIIQPTLPTSSHGPIKTASIFTTPKDQYMASLQPSIHLMPPSSTARKTQEKWAQSTIPKLASNTCPEGNKFTHHPPIPSLAKPGGYQCSGGRHFITDTLLSSGSPGIYYLLDPSDTSYLSGPYYPSSTDPSTLLYSGPEPKSPPHAPDWIAGASKGNFNTKTGERESVRVGRTVLGRASDRDVLDIARGLGVVGLSAEEARRMCVEFVNSKG